MRGLQARVDVLLDENALAEENAVEASRTHAAELLSAEAEKEDLRRTVRQLRAQVGSAWG